MTRIPELPAGFVLDRPGVDDAAAILAVVAEVDTQLLGYVDCTLDDIRESLTAPYTDPAQDHWVVRAGDRIVGWACVDSRYGNEIEDLDVYVEVALWDRLLSPLLAVLTERSSERAAMAGRAAHTANCWSIVGDELWPEVLESAGFSVDRRFNRMHIDLAPGRDAPEPPAGVTLRGFDPASDADWADWHAVLTASFAGQEDFHPSTLEAFRAKVSSEAHPGYPDWRFAEVDGRPVAICQCPASDVGNGGGMVRNLGVLASHRGRGIGRTLLLDTFSRYAAQGMTSCRLGVDTANPNQALSLYEGVGMRVIFVADRYARRCPAGVRTSA